MAGDNGNLRTLLIQALDQSGRALARIESHEDECNRLREEDNAWKAEMGAERRRMHEQNSVKLDRLGDRIDTITNLVAQQKAAAAKKRENQLKWLLAGAGSAILTLLGVIASSKGIHF